MSTRADQSSKTRERMLLAAGEVFAEYGFRRATVREICRRAKSNVAAVNYHFRDKGHLYAAVLRYAQEWAQPELARLAARADLSAAQRLRAFVDGFLGGMSSKDRPAWFGRLMAQELMEPTAVLDKVVAEFMRPRRNLLISIVRDLVGPQATAAQAAFCAVSIVGQCLHFHFGRPITTRLNPDLSAALCDTAAVAEHITRFSLAACRHLQGDPAAEGAGDRGPGQIKAVAAVDPTVGEETQGS